ncbi:MAG TPA: hypothetical protein VIT67_00125 [Povalibacter sp.]
MAMVLIGLGGVSAHAAEEPAPRTFIELKFEGTCDAQNNRLWLGSTHTFKTIAVTVRWRAAGGKDLVEQFFTPPGTRREIGCAADAEVTEVAFADF